MQREAMVKRVIKRVNAQRDREIKSLRKAELDEEKMVSLTYAIIAEALDEGLTDLPYDYYEIRAMVDSHKFLDIASIYNVIMEQLRARVDIL